VGVPAFVPQRATPEGKKTFPRCVTAAAATASPRVTHESASSALAAPAPPCAPALRVPITLWRWLTAPPVGGLQPAGAYRRVSLRRKTRLPLQGVIETLSPARRPSARRLRASQGLGDTRTSWLVRYGAGAAGAAAEGVAVRVRRFGAQARAVLDELRSSVLARRHAPATPRPRRARPRRVSARGLRSRARPLSRPPSGPRARRAAEKRKSGQARPACQSMLRRGLSPVGGLAAAPICGAARGPATMQEHQSGGRPEPTATFATSRPCPLSARSFPRAVRCEE
jgi:hypothetical protein